MARKTNLKTPVKLDKDTEGFLEKHAEYGKQFEDDSMESRAWQRYLVASREYEEAFTRLNQLDEEDPAYKTQLREVDKRQRIMFSTFDAFQASTRHTITVADDDITVVMMEALTGNLDALPDYQELSGLERHREFKRVTQDILADFKSSAVKIHEDDSEEAPLCGSCEEELS